MDEATVRRLAFAKYLYKLAVEQSRAPEPMNAAAVLMLHDAIEFFLQVASEYLNTGANQPNFIDYWEIIGRKLAPEALTQKEAMRRLNKSRVALKHHGTMPSQLDVESFRATATSFFEENTLIVFGAPFGEISLAGFVSPEKARQEIEKALSSLGSGDFEEAINHGALAFRIAMGDYERRKLNQWIDSPFQFGESFSYGSSDLSDLRRTHERTSRLIEKLVTSVQTMQAAMRIVALGIDYRRYARFQLLAPQIGQTLDGALHIGRDPTRPPYTPTAEDARYVIDFVIDAAIRILDFDYNVPKPEWLISPPAHLPDRGVSQAKAG
jgi:hypothetical protein